ncbi:MAG: valine--tRNA ligase [Caldisericia bacterium]|nr:valine--tRNA ligase [Caldisericia bacterium]
MLKFTKGAYPANEIEPQIYERWESQHLFQPTDQSKDKIFSITMPPPNITGALHLGHALDLTLPDIICRYKRMNGYSVCWFPGTDQAGLATDNKVEAYLKKQGIRKEDIGREAFIEKVWEWKAVYGNKIVEQMKLLGTSADWSKLRFTKDEDYEKAVVKAFVTYYEQGLIYRGKRMVQYCPRCKTALSDIEVSHENVNGELVYIKYFLDHSKEFITIATTRVETMLGDTAIAVHPDDPRYTKYHGKYVVLPLVGRKIPIITDDYVEKEFGTGALKVTPCHDPNDFELGKKHHLDFITVIENGQRMNDNAGIYKDMLVKEAREAIKRDLEEKGFLLKVEPFSHSVGHCERCKHVLEPIISDQWYLRTKTLAEKGLKAVNQNDIQYIPSRWKKVYTDWMENILDWCISRQIWWGIRIPVWYCNACGEMIVSETPPKNCPECSSYDLRQEEDVLDTWFGSALWPFACMGWPNDSESLHKYYPTSLLVTAFDIIFFWVSRMIFSSLHFLNSIPFETVYFHGLVLDNQGKKMSKSSSNAVDPTSLIQEYGADALRYTVTTYTNSSGQDIRFDIKKNKASRNFINKIWNAGSYVLDNTQNISHKQPLEKEQSIWDDWIVYQFNETLSTVQSSIESYSFNEAAQSLYSFFWHDFCDWYIEISKTNPNPILLRKIFALSLQIIHPIAPFVTEALWLLMEENNETSIMYSPWPSPLNLSEERAAYNNLAVRKIQEIIRVIRNIKAEFHLAKPAGLSIGIKTDDEAFRSILERNYSTLSDVAKVEEVYYENTPSSSLIATIVDSTTTVFFPKDRIDIESEIENKKQRILKIEKELEKLELKRSNENFMKYASEDLVQEVQANYDECLLQKQSILQRITDLTKE